ncbi:hypothetical protein W97_09236 [Coniosporium apollinis CBS 100218]|uniref:Uncharacterized protein n=1 Tax=Coniosporium apollinis (strain CBS 100218) TaxID=1168221 RepID=R7Z7Q1_CONA1|nr:uncharacterized protein W97_09236 [Coniosporium apollinis CBS 100218]EON69971.1 hypothetical protein W97_09236 [Coniosporium apollinis CBS 100218]
MAFTPGSRLATWPDDNSDDSPDDMTQASWKNPTFMASIGMPMPSFPTPAQVEREARSRAGKIFEDWTTLNALLERYEEVLRKRWAKKTKEQRKKILLTAWPNMSATHRPDFQVLRDKSRQQAAGGQSIIASAAQSREAFLWPYINLEDLTKSKALLLFLNARGRHLPHTFAYCDIDAAHVGYVSHTIVPPFLNEYTMLFNSQTTPETYGRLYSWEENNKALDWMITGVGFPPGHGLNLLEIQERILHFLVECCQLILHDVPPSALTDPSSVATQPEPPSIISAESNGYLSLAALAAETPYRIPSWMDFKRLEAFIGSKVSEAEDHIWLLREDPSYFAETVVEWKEHRQEVLPDIYGNQHPVLGKPLFWNRVLGNVVTEAYGALITWSVIHRQLVDLTCLRDKYNDSISRDKPLPKEYQLSLRRYKHLLEQTANGPLMYLKTGVPASPPLRTHWVREPQDPNSTIIRVRARGKTDYLLFMFSQLFDKTQRDLCGLHNLVEDFERQFQQDPKQKKDRLSSWVIDKFSDLAFISELQRQLRLYQPRLFEPFVSPSLDDGTEEATEEGIKKDFAKEMSPLANLLNNAKDMRLADVGEPSERRFHYPADKRRTKANTAAMRRAEEHLDQFWKRVNSHYIARTGHGLHDSLPSGSLVERLLQRTGEWVEPERVQKGEEEHTQAEGFLSARFSTTLGLDHERTQRTVSQLEPARPKSKIKT